MFTLGLDLDGVVGDYTSEFRRFVSRYMDVPESEIPDPVEWNFANSGWPFKAEDFIDVHARAVRDGMFRSMKAYPGASQVLWDLANQDVKVRVITHRLVNKGNHDLVVSDTVRWLDNHNIPYSDICFVGQKAEVGADVYLEDSPSNIIALREAGNTVVVYDAAYNRDIDGPRVHNWPEVEEFFKRYVKSF